jgi:uncharacterized protein (TIGR03435 family)
MAQSLDERKELEVAAIHESAQSNLPVSVLSVIGTRLEITNYSIRRLVADAYGVAEFCVSGPSWISSARYDVSARMSDASTKKDVPELLQSLMANRFALQVHKENNKTRAYVLVIDKGGPKLKASLSFTRNEEPTAKLLAAEPGWFELIYRYYTLAGFAEKLSTWVREPIVDSTGLDGKYDIPLSVNGRDLLPKPSRLDPDEELGPSIVDSLKRIGLKLEPRMLPLVTIVVDNVSRPTAN